MVLSVEGFIFVTVVVLSLSATVEPQDCDAGFTVRPENVVALAGEMALMACEYATSSGNVTVEWNKNGTSLMEGDLPCDCQVMKNGSLLFNSITSNDVGEYTCVARVASEQYHCSAVLNGVLLCIYDNDSHEWICSSFNDNRTVAIIATDESEQFITSSIIDKPPPKYPELDLGRCAASSTGSRMSINCVPTNFLSQMTCSFNEGSIVEYCGFPLRLDSQRFGDGYHTVVVTITDEFSQTKTFIFGFRFTLPPVIYPEGYSSALPLVFVIASPTMSPTVFPTVSATVTVFPTVQSQFENESTPSTTTMIAVVVSVVGLVLILAIVIVTGTLVFFWRNVRKQHFLNDTITREYEENDVPLEECYNSMYNQNDVAHRSSIGELQRTLPRSMIFQAHQIHLSNTVGQGEFGLVYKAYLTTQEGSQIVAVKTGKALVSSTEAKKLMKELTTMLSFDHPNVMSLIGMCLDREAPLIIMPFMLNGSVLEYVKQRKHELFLTTDNSETEILTAKKMLLSMCHQIAKGMKYLADNKFVHRDLAARNCMIDRDGVIKVADFGLTEDMYGTNYFRRRKSATGSEEKVPIRWMAPESIEDDIYNESTDVWAFGVTCWEVFTCGRVPYSGISVLSLVAALRNGERLEPPNNAVCSLEIYTSVMSVCWERNPQQRPTFSLLVQQLCRLLEQESCYLELCCSFSYTQHTHLLETNTTEEVHVL